MKVSNLWIVIALNSLALLMLISVITSQLFHLPVYDDTLQTTLIVLACGLTSLSACYGVKQTKENNR